MCDLFPLNEVDIMNPVKPDEAVRPVKL